MSYLIFDTETSNFPSPKLLATDINQARIIQLAWLLLDEQFQEVACFNSLIRLPEPYRISSGAQVAHGISQEKCNKFGVDIQWVFPLFNTAYSNATKVIAHNIKFDSQLLDIEYELLYNNNGGYRIDNTKFCTMEAMTPICKLPSKFPGSRYKWPKLQEAYKHCFGKEFDGAHDALADVRATASVFKWLVENKHINL